MVPMKIGILTYHYALNCGAALQALALQEYLTSEGHQVEFINYENEKVNLAYKLFRFRVYKKRTPIKSFVRFLNELDRFYRYPLFKRCVKNNLHISDAIQSIDSYNLSKYDTIIIGSDQLWNKKITGGYDFFYSAQFNNKNNTRVIGYAISMNNPTLNETEKEEMRKIVGNFNHLSVRESSSVGLLQPLTSKRVNLVIDPTFLLRKERWMKYVHPVNEKEFICCYPVLNQEKVKERAKEIAKVLNKKLVILEPVADSIFMSGSKKIDTPFDFVSYLANADLVLTSSFHGTAFSLIFQKEFYILGDDKSNVRMKNFLGELGLQERIIPMDSGVDVNNHIDYKEVDKKLEIMINNSKQFLKDSINS